jgi:hypothetical protein
MEENNILKCEFVSGLKRGWTERRIVIAHRGKKQNPKI